MPSSRTLLAICVLWVGLAGAAHPAEKWLAIGDSLTKEYSLEFPFLFPDNPAAWGERNWLELLSTQRSEHVDIGPLALWPDSRLTGHEMNFAFPGSTSTEWEEILTSTFFSAPENVFLRAALDHYLTNEADRVVIFLGGNDLKNNYGTYYEGANPEPFIAKLVSNMRTIVEYVRRRNGSVPIVLVDMPDVGITPTVQESKPDPEQRQRVTALTLEVNERLRLLAREKGIGLARIGALSSTLTGPEPFVIGGVRFFKSTDPASLSNRSRYLFAPDGFHPNTAPQLLFANAIVEGFNEGYPALPRVRPFSSEEMLTLLRLDPDISLEEWAAGYGVDANDPEGDADGDGHSLVAEFALGMDPRIGDTHRGPTGEWTGERLEMRYHLRVQPSSHFTATPEFSTDLREWTPVPEDHRDATAGNAHRAWVVPPPSPAFLRLTLKTPAP